MKEIKKLLILLSLLFCINFSFSISGSMDFGDGVDKIFYDTSTSDFVLYRDRYDNSFDKKYQTGLYPFNVRNPVETCEVNWDGNTLKAISENNYFLQHPTVTDIKDKILTNLGEEIGNQVLDNNLWMNVNIKYKYNDEEYKDRNSFEIKITDTGVTKQDILDNMNIGFKNSEESREKGVYISVEIKDGKCGGDFENFGDTFFGQLPQKINTKLVNNVNILDDINQKDNFKIGFSNGLLKFQNENLQIKELTNDNYNLIDIALISHNFKKFRSKADADLSSISGYDSRQARMTPFCEIATSACGGFAMTRIFAFCDSLDMGLASPLACEGSTREAREGCAKAA